MEEDKVKVRLQHRKHIYIHNDLSNASNFLTKRVWERAKNEDREGIAFDIMSALTMLAFTDEAHLNFIGDAIIKDWKEREKFHKKLESVFGHLKIEKELENETVNLVRQVHHFRNLIGHGKPQVEEIDQEQILSADELDQNGYLTAEWEKYVNEDFLTDAHTASRKFWNLLLENSDLTLFDTLTHGTRSVSFIEHVKNNA